MGWTDPPTCKSCGTKCKCYDCPSDTSCRSDCTRNNCGFCGDCKYLYPALAHDEDELKIFVQDLFVESKKQKEIIDKLVNKIKILALDNEKMSKRISTLETVYNFKLNPDAKPFYPK